MLAGKRIILGITGGIAAYKSVLLLRELQQSGAEVRVVATPSALRFVGLETLASLSKYEVGVQIFPENTSAESWTRHIHWGEWADLFVIAPCTANTIAKIAHGFSDNMLTATVLAARCPILICPTMDGEMYEAPASIKNMEQLEEFGYHVMEPDSGYLASGLEGKGRLPEIPVILNYIREILSPEPAILTGKKVVVTAGPTREFIDPVRFISNPSTGKMGFAMVEAAKKLGADVTLIHGPVSIPKPSGVETIAITSAAELFEAVKSCSDADIIVMSAAVADFTPTQTFAQKVKKEGESCSSIPLKQTTDILAWLGENKRKNQVLIGFAMETQHLLENAAKKLKRKNADYIIANSLITEGAGFGVDTNHVHLIDEHGSCEYKGSKKEISLAIFKSIFSTA